MGRTIIQVPSGRFFTEDEIELLQLMNKYGFVRYREVPFKLNSGIMSNVYVFGREDITDNPDLEWIIGRLIAHAVWHFSSLEERTEKRPCLIGIPTAGTALAQAAAMVYYKENQPWICHRVMKEMLKEHGAHPKWVNGDPRSDVHVYWTIDNVVTDGQSKFKANERLRESGYPVDEMPSFVLVDRQQGGIQNMEKAGFKRIVVAYKLLDLTFAFGEMGLWPKNAVKAVEEEIKAHQLLK